MMIASVVGAILSLVATLVASYVAANVPRTGTSTPPTSSAVPTAFPALPLTVLVPLGDSDPFHSVGPITMGSTRYRDAVILQVGNKAGGTSLRYDLGGRYTRLLATAGLGDEAPTDTVVTLSLAVDGKTVMERRIGVGQTVPVSIAITGGARLEITAKAPGADCCVSVGLADPVLT